MPHPERHVFYLTFSVVHKEIFLPIFGEKNENQRNAFKKKETTSFRFRTENGEKHLAEFQHSNYCLFDIIWNNSLFCSLDNGAICNSDCFQALLFQSKILIQNFMSGKLMQLILVQLFGIHVVSIENHSKSILRITCDESSESSP